MENVKFDANGLICAIAQDYQTGEVLMQAYMNAEALDKTLETGYAHYYSRSRNSLWKKGETSGHTQRVISAAFASHPNSKASLSAISVQPRTARFPSLASIPATILFLYRCTAS